MVRRSVIAMGLLSCTALALAGTPREFKGHTGLVYAVAFSPDGKVLKSLGGHKETVYNVAFSPNGQLLASSSNDTTVKVWDVKGMKELKTLAHKDSKDGVTCVVFLPDNKTLLSAGFDKQVHYWDAAEGKERKKLPATPDDIFGL